MSGDLSKAFLKSGRHSRELLSYRLIGLENNILYDIDFNQIGTPYGHFSIVIDWRYLLRSTDVV
jgi:hypothetical protein